MKILILLLCFCGCSVTKFDVPLSYNNWVKNTSGKDSIFYDAKMGNCGFVCTKLPNPIFVDTMKWDIKVTDHYPFSIFGDTVVIKVPIWDTIGSKVIKLEVKKRKHNW